MGSGKLLDRQARVNCDDGGRVEGLGCTQDGVELKHRVVVEEVEGGLRLECGLMGRGLV